MRIPYFKKLDKWEDTVHITDLMFNIHWKLIIVMVIN